MSHITPDSEQALENATMALFAKLGWQTADCFEEVIGPHGTLGRETTSQIVLILSLRPCCLNWFRANWTWSTSRCGWLARPDGFPPKANPSGLHADIHRSQFDVYFHQWVIERGDEC